MVHSKVRPLTFLACTHRVNFRDSLVFSSLMYTVKGAISRKAAAQLMRVLLTAELALELVAFSHPRFFWGF